MGLDNRLPDDTLFMVFEEDYRFFPENEDSDKADDYAARMVKVVLERGWESLQGSESQPPQTQSSSSSQGKLHGSESLPPQSEPPFNVFGPASSSKGKSKGKGNSKPKPESRFHATASRGSSNLEDEENEGFSSNLADLVRWATVAHRQGMGNLVWVGWCPAKDKRSRLSNGSHCVMVSKTGLSHMTKAFFEGKIRRGHIDLVLKEWLSTGSTAARVGACYVFPTMGGFTAHASGCDPFNFGEEKGGRPSNWKKDNPALGTRTATDPSQRGKWLIQWAEKTTDRVWKGCPDDKDLVQAKWKWRSIREPTASVPAGFQQNSAQQNAKWDPANPEGAEPSSKRYKRLKRQHEMRDSYRHWTTSADEAAGIK